MEQAIEVLGSIKRVNRTDAKNLLANYGSISNVIQAEDYGEFLNIEGIGQSKIDALNTCFKGSFYNS